MKDRYEIIIESSDQNTYPNDFKCWVDIMDMKTGELFTRRGYGTFIGNFSPIWISFKGKRVQISELKREEFSTE